MTGWSESNIKVLMHRGRKNMQELLEKMLQHEVKSLI
jgi:DNA-directed RNA polymerase specialized sigma24 family protein